jgi:hypothetical protein
LRAANAIFTHGDFNEGGVMKQLTNQSTGKQLLMVAALDGCRWLQARH